MLWNAFILAATIYFYIACFVALSIAACLAAKWASQGLQRRDWVFAAACIVGWPVSVTFLVMIALNMVKSGRYAQKPPVQCPPPNQKDEYADNFRSN